MQKSVVLAIVAGLVLLPALLEQTQAISSTASVQPSELNVPAFKVFTIDINTSIIDYPGLFAWEMSVTFRNDTIKLIEAQLPEQHFLEPVDAANQIVIIWQLQKPDTGNETIQTALFAYTLLAPETPRTGSGVLLRLKFVGQRVGQTAIDLDVIGFASTEGLIFPEVQAGIVTVSAAAPDLNEDGIVDIFDLATVALSFGTNSSALLWNAKADLNTDGIVDILDITVLAEHFGEPTGYG